MQIDTILFLCFGVFLALMFFIMYVKDLESSKKFERYARSIEDLNRQLHKVRQELAQKKEEDKLFKDEVSLQVHRKVKEEIDTKINPLLSSMQGMEEVVYNFQNNHQQRMNSLEQKTKSMSLSSSLANERQVVNFHAQGKKASEIARDLRVGIGEVEFILKMNNLL